MTIASKLETINEALSDIKTAIVAKGVTPSGDITTYSTAISNISGGQQINNQDKTVSAETSQKYVTFDSGYTGLGTVTINAVDSSIDNNIISGNIIEGKSILGVPGSAKAGASDYNFIIVGNSPTVDQNGILSGFSGEDHVKHLDYYRDTINSLEFLIKIKTPVEMGNISSQYICKQGFLTLLFTKNNDVPCFFTNGQSSNISLNTTYYIKATWDGSNYTVSYSTNNSSWTQMISREMTSNPYTSKFIFGNVVDETWHNTQPFAGEIDLANTYIKVNGSTYWTWKTMNYPLDVSEDGFYVSDSRYTGIRSVNVHVLDGAAEMLAEIISGSGSVHTDESISE